MPIDWRKLWEEIKTPFSWRRVWVIIFVVVGLVCLVWGGTIVNAFSYKHRVFPETYIGYIPVGGMNAEQLKTFLRDMNDKLVNEGWRFFYKTKDGQPDILTIYPVVTSEGDSIELISVDIEKDAEYLLDYQKHGSIFFWSWRVLAGYIMPHELSLQTVRIDQQRLKEILQQNLSKHEVQIINSSVNILSQDPLDYEITTSSPGQVYDYQSVPSVIKDCWMNLRACEIEMNRDDVEPVVKENDIKNIANRLPNVLSAGGMEMTYTDLHTNLDYNWKISPDQIKVWLDVQQTETGFAFGLNPKEVEAYLVEKVKSKIDVEAHDAKFAMDANGRVSEFQGSRPGITLDSELTYQAINTAFLDRTLKDDGLVNSVPVVVARVEPKVQTGDVNDLGIREILGIGISDYSNSPNNRKKNIANAVKKLNGVLIGPEEEFSTLKNTSPFTLEGGYFPELVIKGDEIKPEVGGGLCQIGTTLFRMAMNSGMKITMRRNHSLVVSHYDDPVNGNPGTDATVYDPSPDFRFVNDTGKHVLIQTFMDTKEEMLYFTLWGTGDGRKAWYDHPTVKNWIGHGEAKTVETTSLEPGQKKCQNAFNGADAYFTYTRQWPDGNQEKIVYESHYRPLPQICLVGVEEKIQEQGVSEEGSCGLDKDCLNQPEVVEMD